jgi:hypothetical protein
MRELNPPKEPAAEGQAEVPPPPEGVTRSGLSAAAQATSTSAPSPAETPAGSPPEQNTIASPAITEAAAAAAAEVEVTTPQDAVEPTLAESTAADDAVTPGVGTSEGQASPLPADNPPARKTDSGEA